MVGSFVIFWGVNRKRVWLHTISIGDNCYLYLDYPAPPLLESSSSANLMDIFIETLEKKEMYRQCKNRGMCP